jgi:predicted RNase H-like HicB family nuclease
LPEWEEQAGLIGHTHGKTYAEAVTMGEELLEMLIEGYQAEGKTPPIAQVYATTP